MLFDLRGRGRRRTVQVIYLSLALLMGGGLVLFGIGSDQSGGLVDAFSDDAQGRQQRDGVGRQAHRRPAREGARQPEERRRVRAARDPALPARGHRRHRAGRHATPRPASAASTWPPTPGSAISRSIPSSPTCAPRTSWSRPTRASTSCPRRVPRQAARDGGREAAELEPLPAARGARLPGRRQPPRRPRLRRARSTSPRRPSARSCAPRWRPTSSQVAAQAAQQASRRPPPTSGVPRRPDAR